MKKILNVILLVFLMFTIVSCKEEIVLTAPTNVQMSEAGLITWDSVPDATS